ncbi:MAG: PASTA domain-containing protein [Actinobacteria bacterium]|nr:PASTA domain-containing protein [Actinomycetota bacterium]
MSSGPIVKEVPAVEGQDVADARAALTEAGFKVAVVTRQDDSAPADRVLRQDPAAGTKVPEGATVSLTVSGGKAKVAVPGVVGQDADTATAAIFRAGLVTRRANESSNTVPEGRVIRQSPPAGTQVDKGTSVTIVVSTGPGPDAATSTTAPAPSTTTTTSSGGVL